MNGKGQAGGVLREDMLSVHLSISKQSQLSPPSTGGGHFSSALLSLHLSSLLTLLLTTFFSSFLYLVCTPLFSNPFPFLFNGNLQLFLFNSSSSLCLHLPPLLLVISVDQPIQQWNKAACRITHCVIRKEQKSQALWLTQQHHDTRQTEGTFPQKMKSLWDITLLLCLIDSQK